MARLLWISLAAIMIMAVNGSTTSTSTSKDTTTTTTTTSVKTEPPSAPFPQQDASQPSGVSISIGGSCGSGNSIFVSSFFIIRYPAMNHECASFSFTTTTTTTTTHDNDDDDDDDDNTSPVFEE